MKNFIYYAPTKVYFGKGEHEKVGEIVAGYGFKKVFLHFGGGSVKRSGLLDTVKTKLREAGIDFVEFGGAQPNPVISHAREGIALCRREGCDLVLAVGGGSAIDESKVIAVGSQNDADPWEFTTKKKVPEKALPVGVILTLAATGSEMSASAVITNDELGLKRGYNSDFHRPLFSILNPELTYTVPPYQTACGIVDIMMHTLERYMTIPSEAEISDRIAEGLVKTVIAAGRTAMANPKDYEARANLMWAGSLSHNDLTGCGRSYMTVSHQIEHELSGMFPEVAHGAGLAVIFPAWMRYTYKHYLSRFTQYAVRVWNCEMNFDHPERTALEGIEKTEEYFRSIGMPLRLSELGIGEDSIHEMAVKCTNYGTRVLKGPIEYGEKEIEEIYRLCL